MELTSMVAVTYQGCGSRSTFRRQVKGSFRTDSMFDIDTSVELVCRLKIPTVQRYSKIGDSNAVEMEPPRIFGCKRAGRSGSRRWAAPAGSCSVCRNRAV